MSKTNSLVEKLYDRNPENGNFIIEVSLNNYEAIFNDWDHAPFKRKDIHPGLISFLEDSIDDIPIHFCIDISFYFSDEKKDVIREEVLRKWFKTFYSFYVELEKNKLRRIMKNASLYLFISALLLTSSYFGVGHRDNIVSYTLTEIVVVGGWVFLWEAISRLTFEGRRIRRLIKNYKRFINAEIVFRYKNTA